MAERVTGGDTDMPSGEREGSGVDPEGGEKESRWWGGWRASGEECRVSISGEVSSNGTTSGFTESGGAAASGEAGTSWTIREAVEVEEEGIRTPRALRACSVWISSGDN